MHSLKLYHEDSYVKEFRAYVKKCILDDVRGLYKIELNKTYFYPTGGGQPSDIGKIDECFIQEVEEENGVVWHLSKDSIDTEIFVNCEIDFERRYDFMQSHSGQHLLSAVLYREHGINTVGFHLTTDNLTIDTDKVLESHYIDSLYILINDMIFKNMKFIFHSVDRDEIDKFDLRKYPKVDSDITIMEIEGYDYVPCCGTHVRATGELGLFSIIDVQKYKIGSRISFSFGKRSMNIAVNNANAISHISQLLSLPKENLEINFDSYVEKNEKLKTQNSELETYITNLMTQNILSHKYDFNTFVFLNSFDEILSQSAFSKLLNSLISSSDFENYLILAASSSGKRHEMVLISRFENMDYKLDSIDVINHICDEKNLKGGGTANRAQLKTDSIDELRDAFSMAIRMIQSHDMG